MPRKQRSRSRSGTAKPATARRRATAKRATAKRATARRPTARVAHKRARPAQGGARTSPRRWSAGVMERSDAMDLETGVFKKRSARQVALSLKHSAEVSRRRKSSPFRSAMSMLNFEINRGGKNLSPERRRVLNNAKVELRKAFHRLPG
jgi:Protein of unknown function (DUF3175)